MVVTVGEGVAELALLAVFLELLERNRSVSAFMTARSRFNQ